jgi:hypothetical protein
VQDNEPAGVEAETEFRTSLQAVVDEVWSTARATPAADPLVYLPHHKVTINLREVQSIEAQGEYPDECTIQMCAGQRYSVGSGYQKTAKQSADHWLARVAAAKAPPNAFQPRVQPWMMACFGAEISADRGERNHRFLEEALELVQACECTADEAHQLVDYVFGRPVGEPSQEVGGVMVTLAALCLAQGLDMHSAGETELARIWTKVDVIRAKQAAKPKHSPLPEVTQPTSADIATVKAERRAITFGDIVATYTIAMGAAVLDGHLKDPANGLQWIVNTLRGPGHLPDIEEARALGGAQAWFDAKMAEHEAFRAAHPMPELPGAAAS